MSAAAATAPDQQPAAGQARRFVVSRLKPGDLRPRFDDFEVVVADWTTVLDVLRDIRVHQDRSLTLRYSCCHASCGTCGVRVNGKEVLGCVTNVAGLGAGPIVVEPLANTPVQHDLVVDMRGLYEGLQPPQRPLVRQSERKRADNADRDGAAEFVRFEDCIECGLCLSACPIVGTDPRYLGPAALAAARRVAQEPRGADPAAVLAWVDDEHGCWRCHSSFECSEVCPAGVDPAGAIMALRRELTARKLRRLVGLRGRWRR